MVLFVYELSERKTQHCSELLEADKRMYGASKKDINRHKSFHPLTFANLSKVEQRLAEGEKKEAEVSQRKATLRRERDDDALAALDESGPSATRGRRMDWMFAAEAQLAETPAVSSSNTPDGAATTGTIAPQVAAASGVVSSSDAAKARVELERLRKAKKDPLLRVQEHRNAVVAEAAKALSKSTTPNGIASTADDVKLRLQRLLDARKA